MPKPFYCAPHSCWITNSRRTLVCAIRHQRRDHECGICEEGRRCQEIHQITATARTLQYRKRFTVAGTMVPTIEKYK